MYFVKMYRQNYVRHTAIFGRNKWMRKNRAGVVISTCGIEGFQGGFCARMPSDLCHRGRIVRISALRLPGPIQPGMELFLSQFSFWECAS